MTSRPSDWRVGYGWAGKKFSGKGRGRMQIKVDTSGLTGLADLTAAQIKRSAVRGLNNAAFAARDRIPDIVRAQVDKMSPKLRVRSAIRIQKATGESLTATVTIGGGQGAVLARHEFGFTAKNAIIPISRAGSRAADKYGNLVKRARPGEHRAQTTADTRSKARRKSKTAKRVPRFFTVGRGGRGGLRPGIYERTGGNKRIVRLTKYERNKKYRSSFSLRQQIGDDVQPELLRFIQDSIDFRRNN